MRFLLLFVMVGARAFAAEPMGSVLPLEPIYQLTVTNGKQRFGSRHDIDLPRAKADIERTAFMAVCTNFWLPGLVPIFAVEKTNRFELRRRPLRGQENYTEPVFFALPLDDEADARAVAGRWEVEALRGDSRVNCALELAVQTNAVAGRFDQYSEYRFADMMGGTFRSNVLQLRVEYTGDVYLLGARLSEGKLIEGRWRRDDNSELGTWNASRSGSGFIIATNLVELHEWQRGEERRYTVGDEKLDGAWAQVARPLCRVWRPR